MSVSAGCAPTTYHLQSSQQVLAAIGTVKVSSGENGNTKVHVSVQHLAPPQKVAPTATTYVVWARPNVTGATPQNIGALNVDDDLEGELHTVTPLQSFALVITPEPSSQAMAPTNPPVLTVNVVSR